MKVRDKEATTWKLETGASLPKIKNECKESNISLNMCLKFIQNILDPFSALADMEYVVSIRDYIRII